jgi:hypothetical protein
MTVPLSARVQPPRPGRDSRRSAVSPKKFWLGGNGVVLHTSDGGRHFGRLPAPPVGSATFTDSREGFREADRVARSTDWGQTFTTTVGPCVPGRPAELAPVSSRVIWALCPDGLMSQATRSTDGGAHFEPLSIPHCCVNSGSLAPATADVAVVAANGAGSGVLRTTDGGVTWRAARAPEDATYSVDFVDVRVGFALVSIGPGPTGLWKTTDAGTSWHTVSLR